ncbi:hypothetical protein EYF80_011585 [Liparis tanakae]|uniref:Uncharacterized protein n=1 Tax=Liparis tanakae TaxID=230148 RepID=A0A4Z2IJ87_9TELE|nr:hypothetical protein EYF80_011585 [Liparis tanakae]
MVISGRQREHGARGRNNVNDDDDDQKTFSVNLSRAQTLGGLRILSISGVCLLEVITGSETRGDKCYSLYTSGPVTAVSGGSRRHFFNPLPPPPPSPRVCRPTNQNPSRPRPVCPSPGVAAAPRAAAVAEEEQQGEQDQRPPGEDAQQHQQQHIVLHLARRHGHVLLTGSRGKRLQASGFRLQAPGFRLQAVFSHTLSRDLQLSVLPPHTRL